MPKEGRCKKCNSVLQKEGCIVCREIEEITDKIIVVIRLSDSTKHRGKIEGILRKMKG